MPTSTRCSVRSTRYDQKLDSCKRELVTAFMMAWEQIGHVGDIYTVVQADAQCERVTQCDGICVMYRAQSGGKSTSHTAQRNDIN